MTAPAGAASLVGKPIRFVPNTSAIELPFYAKLFALKLDHDKLNDSMRPVLGLYEPLKVEPEYSSKIQILGNALTSDEYASLYVSLSLPISIPLRELCLFHAKKKITDDTFLLKGPPWNLSR